MLQEDLNFLDAIFSNNDINDFKLIIVNQTDEEKQLFSNLPNVKVINSFERGSPASRNLAIKHATADVCLMADDDIIYLPHLKEHIETAYQNHPKAAMISFQAIDETQKLYTDYFPPGIHDKKSLKKIYTWVISFKRAIFKAHQVYFNHYFGVGSVFKGETEYVFLRNGYDKGLKMVHVAKNIVQHPNENSGKRMGSDNSLFARSALAYRFYGHLSYLWLAKFVFFIYRHHYITWDQIPQKYQMGISGISKYKELSKAGLIDKIYDA